MASTDGSTPTDPTTQDDADATRRARTAAEQRHELAATSDDPEVLAAEIERTREELADTLDAIADKVSPKRVAGRTKQKVGDKVKEGADSAATGVKAGAAHLREAAHDAKQAVQDKASTTAIGVHDDLESVGQLDAATTDGAGADLPPLAGGHGLHPVPTARQGTSSSLLGPPAVAGAVAAVLVALLVLRRRRR